VATTSAEQMTLNTQCEVDIFHMFTMVGSLSPVDYELWVITHYYVPPSAILYYYNWFHYFQEYAAARLSRLVLSFVLAVTPVPPLRSSRTCALPCVQTSPSHHWSPYANPMAKVGLIIQLEETVSSNGIPVQQPETSPVFFRIAWNFPRGGFRLNIKI